MSAYRKGWTETITLLYPHGCPTSTLAWPCAGDRGNVFRYDDNSSLTFVPCYVLNLGTKCKQFRWDHLMSIDWRRNWYGCIERLSFNGSNVVVELKIQFWSTKEKATARIPAVIVSGSGCPLSSLFLCLPLVILLFAIEVPNTITGHPDK